MKDEEPKNEGFLLDEHKELVQLYIHEDRLVWNLTYVYIVLNVGLLSVIGALLKDSFQLMNAFISIILCLSGGIFGLFWYFILHRSHIHRTSRMFKAMEIENDLKKKEIPFDTIQSCEGLILQDKVIKDENGKTRDLTWSERRQALKTIHKAMIFFGICWFLAAVVLVWISRSEILDLLRQIFDSIINTFS